MSPPTAAMVVVDRTSLEATRPVVRPRPRSSPGQGPRPAPTRRPVTEPASAPRPDVALPSRPGVPATDRTTALPVTPAPGPDRTTALPITTPRPTPRPPTPVDPHTRPAAERPRRRPTARPHCRSSRRRTGPRRSRSPPPTAPPRCRPRPRPPRTRPPHCRSPPARRHVHPCRAPRPPAPRPRLPRPRGGPTRPAAPGARAPRHRSRCPGRAPEPQRPPGCRPFVGRRRYRPPRRPAATGPTEALAAVLAEVLKVDNVPVDSHFFDDLGADSMLMARFCARLRKQPELPTVSIKDVYRHPTIAALVTALAPATRSATAPGSSSGTATGMAAVLAEVLEVDNVPVDSHFFDDLGADSMLMARFCARLRKQPELPTVSIKDVYRHTTITALAGAFGGTATAVPETDAAGPPIRRRPVPALPDPAAAPMSRSKPRFFLCGLLQLLWMLAFPLLMTFVTANGFVWVAAGADRGGHLPAGAELQRRRLRRNLCAPDPAEVDADRPLEAAPAPRVESRLPAVLAGQVADPGQPAGPLRRQPDLLDLPAAARRQDRPRRAHLLPDGPGVHRPVHRRVGHRHPQGRGHHRLPRGGRCDPDRPGLARPGRLRRRDDRARHRHVDG